MRVPIAESLRREPDHPEQLPDPHADALRFPALQCGDQTDIASHCEVRKQPDLLDHITDPSPQANRIPGGGGHALHQHLSGTGLEEAIDQFQHGGFPRAASPDQRERFTLGQSE